MSTPLAVTIVDSNGTEHPGKLVVTAGEIVTPLWRGVVNPVPEGMRHGAAEVEGSPLLDVTVRLDEGDTAGHTATARFGARVPDGAELAGMTPFRAASP